MKRSLRTRSVRGVLEGRAATRCAASGRWRALALVVCAASSSVGCGAETPRDGEPWERVYVIAMTQMANTPAATSVLTPIESLEDGVVDLGRGVALPDTATLFGVPGEGRVYVTLAQTPRVLRYEVGETGRLAEGPVLDLSGLGLGATFSTRSIVFLEGAEALLLDDTTLQAVLFDREEMTIVRSFDLSELAREGFRTNFAYDVYRREDDVVLTAFHYNATYSRAVAGDAVALLDVRSGELRIARDTRCGAFSTVARTERGDLYFGSDTYSVALRRVGGEEAAPPGCLLRMRAEDDGFDPDFYVEIASLTGGAPGGGAVFAGGERVWVRAFDESLFEVTAATSGLRVLSAPAWHWWRIDLAEGIPRAERADVPAGAGQVRAFRVDERVVAGDPEDDYANTRLVELGDVAQPTPLISLGPGLPAGIVRAR